MEGNACYKFSTIANYVRQTGAKPVRTALDIGANVGAVTLEMAAWFPDAAIYAYEPVEEYHRMAAAATAGNSRVKVFQTAVTAQHRYADDLGESPRAAEAPLSILKGLPAAGAGWQGGSQVTDSPDRHDRNCYRHLPDQVVAITLDELVASVLRLENADTIDLVKFDCEGCEHSCLGCAGRETLERIRFIVGEYHGIARFHRVMQRKLFATHYVSLIGDAHLGAFFAENIREGAGILRPSRDGMLIDRPWLASEPLEWNIFTAKHIHPGEEWAHAL